MIDNKLAQDEAQRTANYEAIKTDVKANVGGEIAAEVRQPTTNESEQVDKIAGTMRQEAANDLESTAREVERGRFFARVSQIVDYVFLLIYAVLGIRLMLALFAANNEAGFVQIIKSITDPLYAPFRGVVPSFSAEGGFTLALPIIVAIIVYALLHFAINRFLRIFVHRKVTV